MNVSRRAFIAGGVSGSALSFADATPSPGASPLLEVDFRKLISKADLVYNKPVPRSEEGIPLGNGRMGSLLWTTPAELRLQINRVDVYANNSATNSFFERHNDYCGGCGYVDLRFASAEEDPFPESGFTQHLSVYDGSLSIAGKGVKAEALAWPEQDVMAIKVQDQRSTPQPLTIALRMLRYETKYFGQQLETFAREHIAAVQNRNHTASSKLLIQGSRIALTQEFREGSYCCKSAIVISVQGNKAKPAIVNETEISLTCPAAPGEFTALIASAATFNPQEDVVAIAARQLDAAESSGFAALARSTSNWWHSFWARGFVSLHSADGTAEFVEQNYHYFLYVMASSSRGKYPPKFNGMIWNTGGDLRTWGAQHWFANLSCYYEALPATNRLELLDPMFAMYSGMFEASEMAARQQWGTKGIYIPETTYFNGLEKLPDEIAAEMQDLYLLRRPWAQRSQRFLDFAQTKHPHSSRWNWIQNGSWVNGRYVITERGFGPYGAVTHILGSTAKIAYLYWRRYEFSMDRDFLRDRAYPMLKGAVEFYRNFPNLEKVADGHYTITKTNSNESIYGARNSDEDVAAMRGVTAALLRASQILEADSEMRPAWSEFLAHLPPLPDSNDPQALKPDGYSGPPVFVRGLKPVVKPGGFLPDGNSLPMWFFDFCNVESRDRRALDIANSTFSAAFPKGINSDTPVSVLSKQAIAAASLGRADAVRVLIPNQIRTLTPERGTAYRMGGVLANRMTLREGPQALDAQRLGRASEALHLALLQSNPPAPGEDPVIHVFPAWPKDWDARFSLLARGAFLVSSSMRKGRIEFVELLSQAGSHCKLRNPFDGDVVLYRHGRKAETLRGSLLEFATTREERILLTPAALDPQAIERMVPLP